MADTRRLLVVSTDYAQTNAVQNWCRSKGYIIATAMTAEDALKHLAQIEDHVVLSDQSLSDRPGDELLRIVHRDYPAVLSVLSLHPSDLLACANTLNEGLIFRPLLKPFSDQSLFKALDDAFELQELRASSKGLSERLQSLTFSWQSRFEEKNRELVLQARRLQISQMLFDTLPKVIVGISADGLVVEANEQARQLFNEKGLVGASIDELLPADVRGVIRKCLSGAGGSTASFVMTMQGQRLQFKCLSFVMSGAIHGCLLYGGAKS